MKHENEGIFNARVHSYLDGELDPREVDEVRRLMDADSVLRRRVKAIGDLQQWMEETRPSPPPALADRVLERIASETQRGAGKSGSPADREDRSGLRGWFGTRLHPAWVGAAGAVLIAGLLLLTQRPTDHAKTELAPKSVSFDGVPAGHAGADLVRHNFRLEVPGAQQVCLVGDFNRWKVCATPLKRTKDNLWQISVALERGRHEYMFVVDNEWISDPRAAVQVDDGFGNRNAVLIL